MNITLKEVERLNEQKILEEIQTHIDSLYKSISFTGINKEYFYREVIKEIRKSKTNYKGEIPYIDFIITKINKHFKIIIKKMLSNNKQTKIIVNKYINSCLEQTLTYAIAIDNFKKLESFFSFYDYLPDSDFLIEIMEDNKIIKEMTGLILKKYKTEIISGNIEKIFDNEILISFIELYCMLNNIEIKDSDEFKINLYNSSNITDSLKQYLNEICRRPLLSKEQEQELLERIHQGDDYAKEIFIESNLKLVVRVAKRYINNGLDFLDLIQEGNIGLIKAIERFDYKLNTKFSSYAPYWIKQSITHAIATNGRTIRIPINTYYQQLTYKNIAMQLYDRLNRKPRREEIAQEMGITVTRAMELEKCLNDTISLNVSINEDDTIEYQETIPSKEDSIEDLIISKEIPTQIYEIFEKSTLTEKEKEVLILRYGLQSGKEKTLDEIGKRFGVCRERIRQIEARAIKKIRKSNCIESIADYMTDYNYAMNNINKYRETSRNSQNSSELSYLPKCKTTKKKKVLNTIYEQFSNYSKEQIDIMLEKLSTEEKELIILRYGNDLNKRIYSNLDERQKKEFYERLLPKMKRLLANLNKNYVSKNNKNKTNISSSEILSDYVDDEKKEISIDDKTKIFEFINKNILATFSNELSIKELVIVSLKLGLINGKQFDTDFIAKILEIDNKEVLEITKKSLMSLKNTLNSTLSCSSNSDNIKINKI